MTHEITADWTTLVRQSQMTAHDYFQEYRDGISFACRYFKASLTILEKSMLEFKAADVVALAQVMATDFQSTCLVIGLNKLGESNG